MTWELVVALVSMASALCAIVFGIRSNGRADDETLRKDAMVLARIEEKLDSVNRCVEEMRVEIRAHSTQIADLTTRIARNEENIVNVRKRIERIEGRHLNENGLEELH